MRQSVSLFLCSWHKLQIPDLGHNWNESNFVKVDQEREIAAMIDLRADIDSAPELLAYLLWNREAQTNSLLINVVGLFELSKDLKKMLLIIFADTHSCIDNFH